MPSVELKIAGKCSYNGQCRRWWKQRLLKVEITFVWVRRVVRDAFHCVVKGKYVT